MMNNDILEPENFYEGYQKKIDELKNNKEFVELDKLQYLVYSTENGKKLLEEYKERYLLPGFVGPGMPNAGEAAVYYEGFKHAYRLKLLGIKAHEQRIQAEENKK